MAESYIKKVSAGGGKSKINYTNAFTTSNPIYGAVNNLQNATSLTVGLTASATATVGSFCLFAGGFVTGGSGYTNVVNAYNTSLTRSTPTALSYSASYIGSGGTSTHAIFAGGRTGSSSYTSTVNAYNTSLTRSTPTALPEVNYYMAQASNFDRVFFAGGGQDRNESKNSVISYNTSLTRSTLTNLSNRLWAPSGSKTPDYVLFAAGGNFDTFSTNPTVQSYNSSLTKTTTVSLASAKVTIASSYLTSYALFIDDTFTNCYNNGLSRLTVASLTDGVDQIQMESLKHVALITLRTGGTAAYYNNSLVLGTITGSYYTINQGKRLGVVGNYYIMAGGSNSSYVPQTTAKYTSLVETGYTYTLTTPTLSNFTITYNYDFNTIGTGTVGEGATLSSSTTFTGFLEIPEEVT
jgi:hypothetical protein